MDLDCFRDQCPADFVEAGFLREQSGEAALHPLESPEKIHGGGTCLGESLADFRKFPAQRLDGCGAGILHAQGNAHGRSHPDGRRAANHHFADGARDLTVIAEGVVNFLSGQAALIQDDHAVVDPFNWLRDVHSSGNSSTRL